MKTIKILIIPITLLLISLSACNEDTIELDPIGVTETSYFLDENQMTKAVFGIYHKVTYFYNFNRSNNNALPEVGLLPSDDLTTPGDRAAESFVSLNGGNGQLTMYYRMAYQLIARANVVLQKIEENGEVAYENNPELRDYHTGEALFLRAWTFFNLWNVFGTAPVVTERIATLANAFPPNSSGTELLDQAIEDLENAVDLLPASWPDIYKGRVTKNSARGMLGKVLVFRGTINDDNADFTNAITRFDQITGVSLTPNYNQNFDIDFENNEESLFEFQSQNVAAGGSNPFLDNDFFDNNGALSCWFGFFTRKPTWIGNSVFTATPSLINAYEAGDPRVNYIFSADPLNTTLNVVKYTRNGKAWPRGGLSKNYEQSLNNARILRYADVLLLKAEAIVRSGGNLAEAVALVNQVRERARNSTEDGIPSAVPADRSTTETDPDVVKDWIFIERRLELACEEGHRWWDLRRRHIIGEIDLKSWDFSSLALDLKFEDYNINFPLPDSEVINSPNLNQNTGY